MLIAGKKGKMRMNSCLTAIMLIMLLLAGCGTGASSDKVKADEEEVMGEVQELDPTSEETECDWQIIINEQIPWTMGESTLNVTFQFIANKAGGIDPKGSWEGKAVMIIQGDPQDILGGGDVSGKVDGLGKDDKVTFVLDDMDVPLEQAPPEGFIVVKPLIENDYYTAGQYLNLTGASDVDILYDDGLQYQEAKPMTGKKYMHIMVVGLEVTAYLDGVGSYSGTCEGIPVNKVE